MIMFFLWIERCLLHFGGIFSFLNLRNTWNHIWNVASCNVLFHVFFSHNFLTLQLLVIYNLVIIGVYEYQNDSCNE
jgi:hypothetical protein